MKPITRKEYYLAKAAGTYTGPTPPPVLREDYYLATLAGDYSGNCPAPVTRIEKYMSAAAGLTSYIPQPVTRVEKYWYAIAKGTGYVPEPVTREEKFLYAVLKNPPKPEYLDKAAQGSLILLTDSVQAPLTSLTLYGHSTQDGTPSPENPVPIVSAGDNGEINVSVSDEGTQSQTLTLSTPNGLSGIPVESGGNYTDETGQQWIADVKDYGAGKYVQNCATVVLDGSEDERWAFEASPGRISSDKIVGSIKVPISDNSKAKMICSAYEVASSNNTFLKKEGISVQVVFNPGRLYVYDSEFTTAGSFTEFLQSNPMTLLYQLSTPIVTDIPAEEIAAYKALHTYTPNTTVSNDADAWMKVGYKANP